MPLRVRHTHTVGVLFEHAQMSTAGTEGVGVGRVDMVRDLVCVCVCVCVCV